MQKPAQGWDWQSLRPSLKLLSAAKLYCRRDEAERAYPLAAEAHELAIAHGFEQIEPQARALLAWASPSRASDEVFEAMRTALIDMAASGSRSDSSLHMLLLARRMCDAQRFDDARSVQGDLIAFCDETGEWAYRNEVEELRRRLILEER